MVMVCVDLEKAYDRVDRQMLWQVLESYGVGGRLGRAVRSLYEVERLKQEAVVEVAQKKQRAWKEKLDGVEGERLVRRVYSEEVTGRRPRGRARKRWMDNFNL